MHLHIENIWFSISEKEKNDLENLSPEVKSLMEDNCELITDFYNLEFKEEETLEEFLTELKESVSDNSPSTIDEMIRLIEKLL